MSRHALLTSLSAVLIVAVIFACQSDKPANKPSPLSITEAKLKTQECVHDSVCAYVTLLLVQLSGGAQPAAIAAINDSLRSLALNALEVDAKFPLEQGFDTSAHRLFRDLKEHLKMAPDWPGGYERSVTAKTLWHSPRFASFQTEMYSFTGGAHGNYANILSTYDLGSGKSLSLTEVVRDTAALVPMLETAFVAAKQQDGEKVSLAELLYEGMGHLPVTTNFCLTEQGVRFFYNPYEVASWAVGSTDVTLTWTQLGALADQSKWK